jgi:hypothetical protein
MRLILEDDQCPICKAELDEIFITDEKDINWQFFDKKLKSKCLEDPEDETIYFKDEDAKKASLSLRNLSCMIHNCPSAR